MKIDRSHIDLEQIIALIPGHIFWKNQDLIFLGCNNQLADYLGYSHPHEIIGKTDYDICLSPEEADLIRQRDLHVLNHGESIENEQEFTFGSDKHYFLTSRAPIRSSAGEIVGVVGISFDFTARKKLQIVEKKLFAEEERIRVMTLLANSIAHELRTPLASMGLGVSGIKKCLPQLLHIVQTVVKEQPDRFNINLEQIRNIDKVFQNIEEEVRVSQTIITLLVDNILSMKDNNKFSFTESDGVSAHSVIEDAMNIYFTGLAYPEVKVNWFPEQNEDFLIFASSKMIVQVLINLLKNAGYFIKAEKKGEINIWLEKGEGYHFIYIEDTAIGIKAEDLSNIFEQFFSKTQNSMGLGLAFCKTIMLQVGGNIECFSEYRKYTRFRLSFPKEKFLY